MPLPVRLDLIEAEILRDPVAPPRRGDGFEKPEHELAGLFARISRTPGVTQYGQLLVQTLD